MNRASHPRPIAIARRLLGLAALCSLIHPALAQTRGFDDERLRALAQTRWQLVGFRSMDDATGTVRPDDPARYTMRLERDGRLTMHLACNQVRGTWSAEAGADGTSGRLRFGALAATRARCEPPARDAGVEAHARFVRGYLLKGGHLYLSLMADGGVFEWAPSTGPAASSDVPAAPDAGGARAWEVATASGPLRLRAKPSGHAAIVARLARGAILDNLGCRRAAGGGDATVVVRRPDGRTRAIFFRMGRPAGADTSQADGYPPMRARRAGDTYRIRLGRERYAIPAALVLGGRPR